ncbi:twin-arginine translocation signal domain-containing protein [Tunturiibacter gelidiferens]|uniref:twin-arginine translocation signal domain-containing protein n=1 Tax=Tunturiibacter gelidiferens TaxID=3069689 RepID=UPI003D9AFBEB
MNTQKELEAIRSSEDNQTGSSRRSFLKGAALTGAATFAAIGALSTTASAEQQEETDSMQYEHEHLKKGDRDILIAAQIAEALAVTTYTNIINTSPFFKTIPDDDQGYLIGARQEEMSHYLLEQSVTDQFTPFTQFFYPKKCSPTLRPHSTFWSLSRTHSSRLILLAFATSPLATCASPRLASWASKAITGPLHES